MSIVGKNVIYKIFRTLFLHHLIYTSRFCYTCTDSTHHHSHREDVLEQPFEKLEKTFRVVRSDSVAAPN
jgi:hypothetical protein